VKSGLESLGVIEVFWKVAVKPGKPTYMGRSGEKVVFGLPGNPLSVLAMFTVLVKPYLRAAMGYPEPASNSIKAKLTSSVHHKPGRREFVPGRFVKDVDGLHIAPVAQRGSHMLSGMARANAWIDIPEQAELVPAGSVVSVVPQ
jgi:molybdopterin molybdotransferase